ncbi:MAG: hypothetical protein JEZ02_13740, partial [Desulfatibacillum sp.]|nr:hypothetical protein [Desulfatibacillum sp.]
MRISRLTAVSDMQLAPFTLSFIGEYAYLEQPFRNFNNKNTLRQARVAGLMAFLFYALFGIMDAYWAPEHKWALWMIRYGIVCPFFFSALALTFYKK